MAAKSGAASSGARRARDKKQPSLPLEVPLHSSLPPSAGGTQKLDRLVHERLRLGILSALSVNETLTFGELKKLLDTTDGNLSVHARKLEEAGYVACQKSFEGRMPKTEYKLTASGQRALERYLDHMEALIRATRER